MKKTAKVKSKMPEVQSRYSRLNEYLAALAVEDKEKKPKKVKKKSDDNPEGFFPLNLGKFSLADFSAKVFASYEGFTQVVLNLDLRSFKIERPVKMYGVEVVSMTFDQLIARFIKNWREWTNSDQGRVLPANFFDWIKTVCRYKNLYLDKIIENHSVFDKSVPELYIGEVIMGKQSTKRSHKRLLLNHKYSTMHMTIAPDLSLLHARTAIQDLIELNYLIEFEISRVKEDQNANLYRSLKQQIDKIEQLGKSAKYSIWSKYWDSPHLRSNCIEIMDLVESSSQQADIAGLTAERSAMYNLMEFEQFIGRMEQMSLKNRKAAEGIIRFKSGDD